MHIKTILPIAFALLASSAYAQDQTDTLATTDTLTTTDTLATDTTSSVSNATSATESDISSPVGEVFTLTSTVVDFPFTQTTGSPTIVTTLLTTTVTNNDTITLTQTAASTVTTSVSIVEETTTLSATNTLFQGGDASTVTVTGTVTEFVEPTQETEFLTITDTVIVSGEETSTLLGAAPSFGTDGGAVSTLSTIVADEYDEDVGNTGNNVAAGGNDVVQENGVRKLVGGASAILTGLGALSLFV